jgi:hypothetical protein
LDGVDLSFFDDDFSQDFPMDQFSQLNLAPFLNTLNPTMDTTMNIQP